VPGWKEAMDRFVTGQVKDKHIVAAGGSLAALTLVKVSAPLGYSRTT
jgi:hypothetical protein